MTFDAAWPCIARCFFAADEDGWICQQHLFGSPLSRITPLRRRRVNSEDGLAADHPLPEAKASLFNCMGILDYERGKHAEALQRFSQGLQHRPTSRTLLINLSATQCMLGRIQEALTTAKKTVRVNPEDADTWRRLGYIHRAAGRTDEAMRCLEKASKLGPWSADSHIALAVMYSLVDRPEETRAAGRQAHSADSVYNRLSRV